MEMASLINTIFMSKEDFPSEIFRVLKTKELHDLTESRTGHLDLEAWDHLYSGQLS